MSCRVMVKDRVIPAVGIQVQSVSIIGIFLYEPSDHRVIVTCTEIILPGNGIILLSLITEAALYLLLAAYRIPKGIILILIEYSVLLSSLY